MLLPLQEATTLHFLWSKTVRTNSSSELIYTCVPANIERQVNLQLRTLFSMSPARIYVERDPHDQRIQCIFFMFLMPSTGERVLSWMLPLWIHEYLIQFAPLPNRRSNVLGIVLQLIPPGRPPLVYQHDANFQACTTSPLFLAYHRSPKHHWEQCTKGFALSRLEEMRHWTLEGHLRYECRGTFYPRFQLWSR